VAISYGKERPVCAEHSEACWAQNRRVRFLIKPLWCSGTPCPISGRCSTSCALART